MNRAFYMGMHRHPRHRHAVDYRLPSTVLPRARTCSWEPPSARNLFDLASARPMSPSESPGLSMGVGDLLEERRRPEDIGVILTRARSPRAPRGADLPPIGLRPRSDVMISSRIPCPGFRPRSTDPRQPWCRPAGMRLVFSAIGSAGHARRRRPPAALCVAADTFPPAAPREMISPHLGRCVRRPPAEVLEWDRTSPAARHQSPSGTPPR